MENSVLHDIPEEIPLIDLQPFCRALEEIEQYGHDNITINQSLQQEVDKMKEACSRVGFLYIGNTGIQEETMATTWKAVRDFFALPLEQKARLDATRNPAFRGYLGLLQGQHNCDPNARFKELKESFTIGMDSDPTARSRVLNARANPEENARSLTSTSPLHAPNQWPEELRDWQGVMEEYLRGLYLVSRALMLGLALTLDLPPSFFLKKCNDPVAQLVLLRYPASLDGINLNQPDQQGEKEGEGEAQQQQQQRPGSCGAHTDCGFLTILAQDVVPGLEVRVKSKSNPQLDQDPNGGKVSWKLAPPIPSTFVVNLGDMVARWTNDRYCSTLHRVNNSYFFKNSSAFPSSDASAVGDMARYSLPFFINCNYDADVECIPSCTDENHPPKYPPIKAGPYIMQKLGLMRDDCFRSEV